MLDKVKVGDQVRFTADKVNGVFTVTYVEVVKQGKEAYKVEPGRSNRSPPWYRIERRRTRKRALGLQSTTLRKTRARRRSSGTLRRDANRAPDNRLGARLRICELERNVGWIRGHAVRCGEPNGKDVDARAAGNDAHSRGERWRGHYLDDLPSRDWRRVRRRGLRQRSRRDNRQRNERELGADGRGYALARDRMAARKIGAPDRNRYHAMRTQATPRTARNIGDDEASRRRLEECRRPSNSITASSTPATARPATAMTAYPREAPQRDALLAVDRERRRTAHIAPH